MQTHRARTALTPRIVAVPLILLVAVLAACGAGVQAGPTTPGGDVDRAASDVTALGGFDEAASEDGGGAGGGGVPPADEPTAALAQQKIIKTGEMSLEVDVVSTSLASVRALALELGGYVGDSQAGTVDQSATVTLRIPASRFGEALVALRELDGEVLTEVTREQDVSTQIVDLDARIANLEASEATYRLLLERAERIEDVLAVQSRLDEVRGQIEQLTAQLENVSGLADLSTLTVTLIPRAQPIETQSENWDPGGELNRALASLVGAGQAIANGLIWFLIVWVPVLLVLGVLALIALRGVLEIRRRVPAPAADRPNP